MRTDVKKRAWYCFLLWAVFVLIKWIMLLSPSSILSKLSPLMLAVRDGDRDYAISGWISLGIETALILAFFLVSRRKLGILYIICTAYSILYVPAVVYWIFILEFEVWRYIQFLPVVVCCVMMLAGFSDYINQQKLKMPKKAQKERQDEGSPTDEENGQELPEEEGQEQETDGEE